MEEIESDFCVSISFSNFVKVCQQNVFLLPLETILIQLVLKENITMLQLPTTVLERWIQSYREKQMNWNSRTTKV